MSNARRPAAGNSYRDGYLRSAAWFARRDRWFREEQARHGDIRCIITGATGTKNTLQLHHLDYTGVGQVAGEWVAGEDHDDLVAVRPDAHEALHTLLDNNSVLRKQRTRKNANVEAIATLRRRIKDTLASWMGEFAV